MGGMDVTYWTTTATAREHQRINIIDGPAASTDQQHSWTAMADGIVGNKAKTETKWKQTNNVV